MASPEAQPNTNKLDAIYTLSRGALATADDHALAQNMYRELRTELQAQEEKVASRANGKSRRVTKQPSSSPGAAQEA